jgi:hypothetical protein
MGRIPCPLTVFGTERLGLADSYTKQSVPASGVVAIEVPRDRAGTLSVPAVVRCPGLVPGVAKPPEFVAATS